jgi:hypothetical protein
MMCGGALIDAAKDFDLAVNVNALYSPPLTYHRKEVILAKITIKV